MDHPVYHSVLFETINMQNPDIRLEVIVPGDHTQVETGHEHPGLADHTHAHILSSVWRRVLGTHISLSHYKKRHKTQFQVSFNLNIENL